MSKRVEMRVAKGLQPLAITLAGSVFLCRMASAVSDEDYARLLQLFEAFRESVPPRVVDGVPDYSAAAMAAQYRQLPQYRTQLDAIDDSDWPVPRRVDYMLVLAEMRGLEFRHRIIRPWQRDPADVSLQLGGTARAG